MRNRAASNYVSRTNLSVILNRSNYTQSSIYCLQVNTNTATKPINLIYTYSESMKHSEILVNSTFHLTVRLN